MKVSGQLHAPTALLPGKEPPILIKWEGGLPQSRSRSGGEEKISRIGFGKVPCFCLIFTVPEPSNFLTKT
jgi:hypothetical protein